jgi:hypothetical protein
MTDVPAELLSLTSEERKIIAIQGILQKRPVERPG